MSRKKNAQVILSREMNNLMSEGMTVVDSRLKDQEARFHLKVKEAGGISVRKFSAPPLNPILT